MVLKKIPNAFWRNFKQCNDFRIENRTIIHDRDVFLSAHFGTLRLQCAVSFHFTCYVLDLRLIANKFSNGAMRNFHFAKLFLVWHIQLWCIIYLQMVTEVPNACRHCMVPYHLAWWVWPTSRNHYGGGICHVSLLAHFHIEFGPLQRHHSLCPQFDWNLNDQPHDFRRQMTFCSSQSAQQRWLPRSST